MKVTIVSIAPKGCKSVRLNRRKDLWIHGLFLTFALHYLFWKFSVIPTTATSRHGILLFFLFTFRSYELFLDTCCIVTANCVSTAMYYSYKYYKLLSITARCFLPCLCTLRLTAYVKDREPPRKPAPYTCIQRVFILVLYFLFIFCFIHSLSSCISFYVLYCLLVCSVNLRKKLY